MSHNNNQPHTSGSGTCSGRQLQLTPPTAENSEQPRKAGASEKMRVASSVALEAKAAACWRESGRPRPFSCPAWRLEAQLRAVSIQTSDGTNGSLKTHSFVDVGTRACCVPPANDWRPVWVGREKRQCATWPLNISTSRRRHILRIAITFNPFVTAFNPFKHHSVCRHISNPFKPLSFCEAAPIFAPP